MAQARRQARRVRGAAPRWDCPRCKDWVLAACWQPCAGRAQHQPDIQARCRKDRFLQAGIAAQRHHVVREHGPETTRGCSQLLQPLEQDWWRRGGSPLTFQTCIQKPCKSSTCKRSIQFRSSRIGRPGRVTIWTTVVESLAVRRQEVEPFCLCAPPATLHLGLFALPGDTPQETATPGSSQQRTGAVPRADRRTAVLPGCSVVTMPLKAHRRARRCGRGALVPRPRTHGQTRTLSTVTLKRAYCDRNAPTSRHGSTSRTTR